MGKIVFTGPESTGKTTLSEWFSVYSGYKLVPEYARQYLVNTSGHYDQNDVRTMGLLQHWEERMAECNAQNLVCDTDLLTILIWQEEKYGKYDADLYQWWLASKVDMYFLCTVDIPWEADDLRENPLDRARLFARYQQLLEAVGKPYMQLKGALDERQKSVLEKLDMG
jgi:nicotinamide riboside kinase